MSYLILGGSSGLGRALAEKFAEEGRQLIIVSQDIRDTNALAAHLVLKFNTKVTPLALDLAAMSLPYDLIDEVLASHAPLRGIIAPAGVVDDDDTVGLTDEKLEKITRVNYLSPTKLINHYLPMLRENRGVVVGFGSVATVRGRSRNAAYAAAKRSMEGYFESLRHYSANNTVSVQYYVLGYLDTNLAFAQKLLFPKAAPAKLAKIVFDRQHQSGVRFFPRYWYFIYQAVRVLPWNIFKRLKF